MVFVLSSFLDNIAAALIGGTVAATVFRHRVHIGYIAALVAASNAGGSGSVVGDTTTTMMWIDGVSPLNVRARLRGGRGRAGGLRHSGGAAAAGVFADRRGQQQAPARRLGTRRYRRGDPARRRSRVNVLTNVRFPQYSDRFPFLGAAVWVAILVDRGLARAGLVGAAGDACKGTVFLLCLVLAGVADAGRALPAASWHTAFGLGFVSAVFDNIPLTKLALEQGGYDWGVLAYAVGFGGSMIWFGSSAGVAITNLFPEARSVGGWLRGGWHVALAYVVGFAVVMLVLGWHPHAPHKARVTAPPVTAQPLPE